MEEKKVTKKEQEMNKMKEELKEELKKEMYEEMNKEKKEDKKVEDMAKEAVNKILDTEDQTNSFDKKDIEKNKGISILSYLGPLCLIPFLIQKDSKYAQYHAKQGLNLFIFEVIFGMISAFLSSIVQVSKMCTILGEVQYECGVVTPWWLNVPIRLGDLCLAVISLIGLIYACQGKAKEVPVLGKIKIIK